ncbi:hypothetical protein HDV00_003881 [Rhizophlyctis rosea]|nr:hypothetical protein HDV00_003881 [Rhizophlyctis rosea]
MVYNRMTEEEKEFRHNYTLRMGLGSAAASTPLALGGAWLANKYSPLFRGLTLPFKTMLVICVPTAVFFTVSDRAAIAADKQLMQRFSVTRPEDVIRPPPKKEFSFTSQGIKDWIVDNRTYVVAYGWLGTVAGMMLYTWRRKDITTSQKLINARMAAQALAIAGVAGIAAITAVPEPANVIDPHFERIVNADQLVNVDKPASASS